MNVRFQSFMFATGLFLPVAAQQFETEIIAIQGAMIQNDPQVRIGQLGKASINQNGELCYRGSIIEDGSEKAAILAFVDHQFRVVATHGAMVASFVEPSGNRVNGTQFESFEDPVISSEGRVAFLASLQVNTLNVNGKNQQVIAVTNDAENLWIVDRSTRGVLVSENEGSTSYQKKRFRDLDFDRFDRLTYQSLTQKTEESTPLAYRKMAFRVSEYVDSSDSVMTPEPIVAPEDYDSPASGELIPFSGFVSAAAPSTDNFRAIIHDTEGDRLIAAVEGAEELYLKTGDQIPGIFGARILKLRGLAKNPGDQPPVWIKFRVNEESKTALCRASSQGDFELIAQSGERVGGVYPAAHYTAFELPVSAHNNHLAFIAHCEQSDQERGQVLCRKLAKGVAPRVLARTGQQVPGAARGVTYRSFSSPQINQLGQVVFGATLHYGNGINESNDFAYYLAEPNREARRIVGKGDLFFFGQLELKEVRDLVVSELTEAGEVALTLYGDQGQGALVKLSIPPSNLKTYEDWAIANFSNDQQRDFNDDPDQDGVTNLLEYAFGSNPNDDASHHEAELILLDTASARRLAVEFKRFSAASDIDYLVEFSGDLEHWEQPSEIHESVFSDPKLPEHETVVVSRELSQSTPKQFVRVRVEY